MYKHILTIAFVMLALDIVYLNLVSNHFNNLFSKIQNKPLSIRILPAILCYITMVFGLYYFVFKEKKHWYDACLLGLVIYGVYDTTNMATLNDWNWITVLLDTSWGAVLFTLTYLISKQLLK